MIEGQMGSVIGCGVRVGDDGSEPAVIVLIAQSSPSPGICQSVTLTPSEAGQLANELTARADAIRKQHEIWVIGNARDE